MDTRSRKWTNKVLITLVMIAMTLSGIYGLDTIHNMAVTGDNSFSLDEQDQSDYIKNTQMSLFDKWADQEGDKVYYSTRSKLPLGTKKEMAHTSSMMMVRITKTWGIAKERFFFSIAVCAAGIRALLSV